MTPHTTDLIEKVASYGIEPLARDIAKEMGISEKYVISLRYAAKKKGLLPDIDLRTLRSQHHQDRHKIKGKVLNHMSSEDRLHCTEVQKLWRLWNGLRTDTAG